MNRNSDIDSVSNSLATVFRKREVRNFMLLTYMVSLTCTCYVFYIERHFIHIGRADSHLCNIRCNLAI